MSFKDLVQSRTNYPWYTEIDAIETDDELDSKPDDDFAMSSTGDESDGDGKIRDERIQAPTLRASQHPEEPLVTTTALVQLEIPRLSRKATRTGLFPEPRDKTLLSKAGTPMGLILVLRLSTHKARAAPMVARKAKVLCRA